VANLSDRVHAVENRVASACARSGRARGDVRLVAVTKTVGADEARALLDLGLVDLGENRPQELWRKAALLPKDVRWHMIGHLQRNKLEKTLPVASLIHSIDSLSLLQAIETESEKQSRSIRVLLQCNMSGEASKQGFAPPELPAMVAGLAALRHVRVVGLMTMAPFELRPEQTRPTFAALRNLRDQMARAVPPPHALTELSMGMSNDFEVAIEEGATFIRLGTILFGDAK
jgi:PLP dependent protein